MVKYSEGRDTRPPPISVCSFPPHPRPNSLPQIQITHSIFLIAQIPKSRSQAVPRQTPSPRSSKSSVRRRRDEAIAQRVAARKAASYMLSKSSVCSVPGMKGRWCARREGVNAADYGWIGRVSVNETNNETRNDLRKARRN